MWTQTGQHFDAFSHLNFQRLNVSFLTDKSQFLYRLRNKILSLLPPCLFLQICYLVDAAQVVSELKRIHATVPIWVAKSDLSKQGKAVFLKSAYDIAQAEKRDSSWMILLANYLSCILHELRSILPAWEVLLCFNSEWTLVLCLNPASFIIYVCALCSRFTCFATRHFRFIHKEAARSVPVYRSISDDDKLINVVFVWSGLLGVMWDVSNGSLYPKLTVLLCWEPWKPVIPTRTRPKPDMFCIFPHVRSDTPSPSKKKQHGKKVDH